MTPTSPGPSKGQAYVCVMVGLPARGKTYTAQRLARYLGWLGYPAQVFNVGERRRRELGARQDAAFFDPANTAAHSARERVARETLEAALAWIEGEGRVAVFDATNTTRERRAWIRSACAEAGHPVLFVEILNDDPAVVEQNVRAVKLSSPDYAGVDPEDAVRDFRARIAHYERVYEPVQPDEGSSIRIFDRGHRVELCGIEGYLPARMAYLLTNLRVSARPIWLTRHGESEFNLAGRIGGDAPLSVRGEAYARSLAAFVEDRVPDRGPLEVWTSTLQRTQQTAAALGRPWIAWRSLDEIDAGVCDGLTYAEIESRQPAEFAARRRDKLRYRYPRGESYEDVIERLDRVIVELERHRTPVLVIAHNAVCRALYTYFRGLPIEDCPHLEIPLHTVLELTPRAYGCDETRTALAPDASVRVGGGAGSCPGPG